MGSFFSESSAFPSATSCCPVVWGSERVRGEGEISKPGITFPGEILFHFEFSEPQPGFSPQQRQEGPDAPTHEHLPTSTFPPPFALSPRSPGAFPRLFPGIFWHPGVGFSPPNRNLLLVNAEHVIAACDRSSQPPFSAEGAQNCSSPPARVKISSSTNLLIKFLISSIPREGEFGGGRLTSGKKKSL